MDVLSGGVRNARLASALHGKRPRGVSGLGPARRALWMAAACLVAAAGLPQFFVSAQQTAESAQLTAKSVAIAKRGVSNVLRHAGIVSGEIEARPTNWLEMPDADCFAFAEEPGLVEFLVDLGEAVQSGSAIARIYPTGRTGAEPFEVHARMNGMLIARHHPGLIKSGDCCAVLATRV